MVKGAVYYDGSEVEIKAGHKVYWIGDESGIRGELKVLNEDKFAVEWEDGYGVQEYDLTAIAELRPW